MKQILGILMLLVVVGVVTTVIKPVFLGPVNLKNNMSWGSLYAIMGIGVAFVIITGGIDLSIGSVVALTGCTLALLLKQGMSVPTALLLVTLLSLGIGLLHGLLVTKLGIQPFVVTLFGLLFYRSMARYISGDHDQGFGDVNQYQGLKYLATGEPFSLPIPFLHWIADGHWSRFQIDTITGKHRIVEGKMVELDWLAWVEVPMPVLLMLGIVVAAGLFLNYSIYGRYLLALGRNQQAAFYSGVNTDRMVVLAYMISALLAGFAGVLFALELNSIQPASQGDAYELYAIAAAVLGGCSLRGGEGSILGVVIGAAVMSVLKNSINLIDGIPTQLERAIIGSVILGGAIVDELAKRYTVRKRARLEASLAESEETDTS